MNHNFLKYSLDPSRWDWSVTSEAQAAPQMTAPNFSGFSAPADKPFLPQFGRADKPFLPPFGRADKPLMDHFGPPDALSWPTSQNSLPLSSMSVPPGARKRRNDTQAGLDPEARQRKVFISEERMLDHMQRLNLDQGPDILQDLAPDAETHSLSGASEFSEPNATAEGEFDAASSIASDEDEDNDEPNAQSSKVVLSDALKRYMERKPEVLPDGLLKQIVNKPMGNPSRALVLWRPPGEQIRDVIRNSLAKVDGEEARSIPMEDGINSAPPADSVALPFEFGPKAPEETPPLVLHGCLPDLLIGQAPCDRADGNFAQMPTLPTAIVSSNDSRSFEQMET